MTQDPRSREYPIGAVSARQEHQDVAGGSSTSHAIQPGIKHILHTLAAHGAGPASAELAFDLVLHEIVEEVREATHATGTAIAWIRDGEMVCRATTGETAPNLGVRVDMRSGLAAESVDTGQIQNCRDTETDSRVNPENYRQLGVRSMMLVPISSTSENLGILQLCSSEPNAFGDSEIVAVRPFISRSIEAWIEMKEGDSVSTDAQADSHVAAGGSPDDGLTKIRESEDESGTTLPTSRSRMNELSNYFLLVAVLSVAVLLGLVLGWKWGRDRVAARSASPVPSTRIAVATASEPTSKAATSSDSPTADKSIGTRQSEGAQSQGAPAGSLVISQDGRVIYHSVEKPMDGVKYTPPERTKLLKRVDPEYPSAAIAQSVQGPVVLDITVLANGNVSDVVVRSGDPLLTESAVEAVRQWRFQPAEDRTAIERLTRVTINFILPSN
jgi:TonB family protein